MRRTTLAPLALLLVASCGSPESDGNASADQEAPAPTKVAVDTSAIKRAGGELVTALRGTSDAGATLKVDGKTTTANSSGEWAIRASYYPSRDTITVSASAPGKERTLLDTPQPKRPKLTLGSSTGVTTFSDSTLLKGRVRVSRGSIAGTRVTVNGSPALVDGSRWSKTVTVSSGTRRFQVKATRAGADGDTLSLTKTRKLSKAEKAARAAQRKAEREAKRARARANYMAGAKTIPYGQLSKNPDRHSGERVTYRGQIMQIQEDLGTTIILMNVTDQGYGFWDDLVWVDYDGTTPAVEDDVVTIYGTVTGSESYETKIGGTNDVPSIRAKYIVQ